MNVYSIRIGHLVRGTYHNVPFTGIVDEARPHTMNDNMVIHVKLDAPITVYDLERKSIAIETNGKPNKYGTTVELQHPPLPVPMFPDQVQSLQRLILTIVHIDQSPLPWTELQPLDAPEFIPSGANTVALVEGCFRGFVNR